MKNADQPNRDASTTSTKSLPKASAPRLPIGLKYIASFFPGGVQTMIHFAWLSPDSRVRDVAKRWRALDRAAREQSDLEDLCSRADVRSCEFLGQVVKTAFELGVDVSPVIAGISQMPYAAEAMCADALTSFAARERAWEAFEFVGRRFRNGF